MMTDEQRRAADAALNRIAKGYVACEPFRNRGFSDRTVYALVECGIDSPERLLFMDEATLAGMRRIGRASMAEIKAYRARFLPS
jgi:DNA-directed RNA polymerase alpha subunit